MKKILLGFGLLSGFAFADANGPACQGEEVSARLIGSYEALSKVDIDQGAKISFSKNEATVTFSGGSSSAKAWTCSKNGLEFLVTEFKGDDEEINYENNAFTTGGSILTLVEFYDDENLDLETYRTKVKEGDLILFKKL